MPGRREALQDLNLDMLAMAALKGVQRPKGMILFRFSGDDAIKVKKMLRSPLT